MDCLLGSWFKSVRLGGNCVLILLKLVTALFAQCASFSSGRMEVEVRKGYLALWKAESKVFDWWNY